MPRAATVMILLVLLLAGGAAAEPPELWFPVGEEVIYRIYWGFIPVARTHVTTEWIEEDGRTLLAIRYRTRTNKIADKIYPVDDFAESIIDPVTFRPIRLTEKMKRRRTRWDETTIFDYDQGLAFWSSRLTGDARAVELEPATRDMMSFMYWMRSQAYVPGMEQVHRILADGKLWEARVKVREVEDVKLPLFGKVPSIRVEPEADFRGIFDLEGRVVMWVSDDERRLCTKLVGKVPVASIKAILCEVRGPGDDRWSQIMREKEAERACAEEAEAEAE